MIDDLNLNNPEDIKKSIKHDPIEERRYWMVRMAKQAAMDIISYGRIGSGNLDPTYSGDVRTQQELNNDETIGDIATFIPGRFSGNNLPNTQFGADEFGYGSSQYSTQESEEDFFYRNKSITDELPGFKFNMKKSDPGYDKNWRDFQNKYEEKRKDDTDLTKKFSHKLLGGFSIN